MPLISLLLSLALTLATFLALVIFGVIGFEPVTPVHVGLLAGVAPLVVLFRWGLRRMGW